MSDTPKVTWRERDRSWRFHYRGPQDQRLTKNVPVRVAGENTADCGRKAQAWCDEWHTRYLAAGRRAPTEDITPPVKVATFRSLHEKWLAYREEHDTTTDNTYKQYASAAKVHFLPHKFSDMPIEELTPHYLVSVIQEWKANKRTASNTIANRCHSLSCFFRDVRVNGWAPLVVNPMEDEIVKSVIPRRIRRSGSLTIYVPLADARKLINAHRDQIPELRRVKYIFALYTGARDGEIQGTAWSQVHLDAAIPYLDITRQWTTASRFCPPKKGSIRQIPLHPDLVAALRHWRASGWRERVGRAPGKEDPVFPDEDGNYYRPHSALFLRQDLVQVGAPAKLGGHNIDAHALRRSFATYLADREVSDTKIGQLMGHAKKGVTDAHYIVRNLHVFAPIVRLFDAVDETTRRGWDSNPPVADLQSDAWPLGYRAGNDERGGTSPSTNANSAVSEDRDENLQTFTTANRALTDCLNSPAFRRSPAKSRMVSENQGGKESDRECLGTPRNDVPPSVPPSPLRGNTLPANLDPLNPAHLRLVREWLAMAELADTE